MKVTELRVLEVEVGWRQMYYLKINTDAGLVGWSEFVDSFGNPGLPAVVEALGVHVVGRDPLRVEALVHDLYARLRPARGGQNRQAVAAVENALLDIKGKAFDAPVAELLGGYVRETVPVYWSHCGTYRTAKYGPHLNVPPLLDYDQVVTFAKEVRTLGWSGLKTNALCLEDPGVGGREIRFARGVASIGRRLDSRMIAEAEKTMAAMREGAGEDADIFFDINYCMDFEGYRRLEQALRPYRPAWLELDTADPVGLARLRSECETPIGSGEGLYDRIGYRPFLDAGAFDVAIVDVPWNGFLESMKVASLAESYSVPVAPHNFYGHLSTAISAQFAAAVPNLNIMEIDVDAPPIRDQVVSPPEINDGDLTVPRGPGWGVEVNEELLGPLGRGGK